MPIVMLSAFLFYTAGIKFYLNPYTVRYLFIFLHKFEESEKERICIMPYADACSGF